MKTGLSIALLVCCALSAVRGQCASTGDVFNYDDIIDGGVEGVSFTYVCVLNGAEINQLRFKNWG